MQSLLGFEEDWEGELKVVAQPPSVQLLGPQEFTLEVTHHDKPKGINQLIASEFQLVSGTVPELHKGPRPAGEDSWPGRVTTEAVLGTVKQASTADLETAVLEGIKEKGWHLHISELGLQGGLTVYVKTDTPAAGAGAQQQHVPAAAAAPAARGSSAQSAAGVTHNTPAAAAAAATAGRVLPAASASTPAAPASTAGRIRGNRYATQPWHSLTNTVLVKYALYGRYMDIIGVNEEDPDLPPLAIRGERPALA